MPEFCLELPSCKLEQGDTWVPERLPSKNGPYVGAEDSSSEDEDIEAAVSEAPWELLTRSLDDLRPASPGKNPPFLPSAPGDVATFPGKNASPLARTGHSTKGGTSEAEESAGRRGVEQVHSPSSVQDLTCGVGSCPVATVDQSAELESLEKARELLTCSSCLEAQKAVAFGCGHQACSECDSRLKVCHTCDTPIAHRTQLLF